MITIVSVKNLRERDVERLCKALKRHSVRWFDVYQRGVEYEIVPRDSETNEQQELSARLSRFLLCEFVIRIYVIQYPNCVCAFTVHYSIVTDTLHLVCYPREHLRERRLPDRHGEQMPYFDPHCSYSNHALGGISDHLREIAKEALDAKVFKDVEWSSSQIAELSELVDEELKRGAVKRNAYVLGESLELL